MEWSGQKLWRIEKGIGQVRALDVKNLCELLYGADPRTTQALMALARETKAKGWWHAYGKTLPSWFELYVGLEAAASRVRWYNGDIINGLLQTASYAEAMVRLGPPAAGPEIARQVEIRMQRQGLLTRAVPPAPNLEFLLDEVTLLRSQDRAVMAGQLTRLRGLTQLGNLTIRVVPTSAGLHPGLDCGSRFAILDFPVTRTGQQEPPVVYSDSLTGAWYGDAPDEVAAYDRAWAGTEAASLAPNETREMITTILEQHQQ